MIRDLYELELLLRKVEDLESQLLAEHYPTLNASLVSRSHSYLSIFQSMTNQEMQDPQLLLLERSRLQRVARGAGVELQSVIQMLDMFVQITQSLSIVEPAIPLALRTTPDVCRRYHSSVISGTCPWCGQYIS